MKKSTLLLAVLMLSIFSCEKAEMISYQLKPGTYQGIFYRTSPAEKLDTSTVTLFLENNEFSGSSSIIKYPAICKGSYAVAVEKIQFTNTCPWTAEFEWTYVLDGGFDLQVKGDSLIMTRSYGESITDTYKLKALAAP